MTRQDYLDKKVTHEQYYTAIAKEAGVNFSYTRSDVDSLLERVKRALAAGDEHLNSIPLAIWDGYSQGARAATAPVFKRHGDFWSLAGGVCVAKQAAKNAARAEQE